MAKAPTLGRVGARPPAHRSPTWSALGHLRSVAPGPPRPRRRHGRRSAHDALVVNCASDGLRSRPLLPIWQDAAITLQPVRAGFPCFGAAVTGYVEATRRALPDADKNRLCAPSSLGNSLGRLGPHERPRHRATSRRFGAEPDTREWINTVALNPARVPPTHPSSAALSDAQARLAAATEPALARLSRLAAGA